MDEVALRHGVAPDATGGKGPVVTIRAAVCPAHVAGKLGGERSMLPSRDTDLSENPPGYVPVDAPRRRATLVVRCIGDLDGDQR